MNNSRHITYMTFFKIYNNMSTQIIHVCISNFMLVHTGQGCIYMHVYLPERSYCLELEALNLKDTFRVTWLYDQTVIIASVS